MMKILIVTDRFLPEIAAPSFRIRDHAVYWVREGHEVTVVTCVPNFPRGEIFSGYENRLYQEEWIEGIRVIRVWSYMAANAGFARRILDQVSFMCSAIILCPRYQRFDVILATSPPLFVALGGYAISLASRRPWIFEIRDLWPASIKAVGLGGKVPFRFLESLELFLYDRADRIIALTRSFRENLIERGIAETKIDVVTNAVDTELFKPTPKNRDLRQNLGVNDDDFLVGYLGTVGMAHGLETVLEAAFRSKANPKIRFLIMGEGSERSRLEYRARELELDNVMFSNFVPHAEVPDYLSSLDLCLVHLKSDPVFRTVIPSKIFEAMAMGIPILHAVEGESARIVREAGAGECIPSGNPKAMAETIMRLINQPEKLREMGIRGVDAAREKYGRKPRASACLETFMKSIHGKTRISR